MDTAAKELEEVIHGAPFTGVVRVVVGLAEKGVDGTSMKACINIPLSNFQLYFTKSFTIPVVVKVGFKSMWRRHQSYTQS